MNEDANDSNINLNDGNEDTRVIYEYLKEIDGLKTSIISI